jgi:hypothetical protein
LQALWRVTKICLLDWNVNTRACRSNKKPKAESSSYTAPSIHKQNKIRFLITTSKKPELSSMGKLLFSSFDQGHQMSDIGLHHAIQDVHSGIWAVVLLPDW